MGDDDIYFCEKRGDQIGVVSAFSTGMSRPVNVDSSIGISGTSVGTSASETYFRCSFRRPITVTKNEIEYNLGNFHIKFFVSIQCSKEE